MPREPGISVERIVYRDEQLAVVELDEKVLQAGVDDFGSLSMPMEKKLGKFNLKMHEICINTCCVTYFVWIEMQGTVIDRAMVRANLADIP